MTGGERKHPVFALRAAIDEVSLSRPTIATCLQTLQGLGLVREVTGRRRHKTYVYSEYLQILNEGTEPSPPGG